MRLLRWEGRGGKEPARKEALAALHVSWGLSTGEQGGVMGELLLRRDGWGPGSLRDGILVSGLGKWTDSGQS